MGRVIAVVLVVGLSGSALAQAPDLSGDKPFVVNPSPLMQNPHLTHPVLIVPSSELGGDHNGTGQQGGESDGSVTILRGSR